jgi:hypothetical protein
MEFVGKLVKKVQYSDVSQLLMGYIPQGSVMTSIEVLVDTAFNSSGTDLIQVGTVADNDAFAANIDVSTAGKATVTMTAAACDITTAPTAVYALYVPGTSGNDAGVATVVVTYAQI